MKYPSAWYDDDYHHNDNQDGDDKDDDDDDDDDHSLPHLNSFSDHHGVSISLDAAVDCFMELFLIDHQVQVTNMII